MCNVYKMPCVAGLVTDHTRRMFRTPLSALHQHGKLNREGCVSAFVCIWYGVSQTQDTNCSLSVRVGDADIMLLFKRSLFLYGNKSNRIEISTQCAEWSQFAVDCVLVS